MIQLKILGGKMAGTTWVARHFPVRVGRSPNCDLQIEEHGIWDEHFQITIDRKDGFILEVHPHALLSVNGPLDQRFVLHNGDLIEIGALKLQFWLGDAAQRGLKIREAFVWAMIAAVTLGQIALIYWLVQS
jgi:predicted component of type VI protein secretion system